VLKNKHHPPLKTRRRVPDGKTLVPGSFIFNQASFSFLGSNQKRRRHKPKHFSLVSTFSTYIVLYILIAPLPLKVLRSIVFPSSQSLFTVDPYRGALGVALRCTTTHKV
jgi:hypothetical protein